MRNVVVLRVSSRGASNEEYVMERVLKKKKKSMRTNEMVFSQ